MEFDVGELKDKYGRLLAYVYVDGKSVQETLLKEGLPRVAYIYP
nr:thermonuclease family protein [Virgibacillus proomii]